MENKETGEQVEDNNFERLKRKGYFNQLGNPIQHCQHCYCGRVTVNGREHSTCCMCGHRILVNPVIY